jgi:predicted patatin/cPLA2 family phospholipase
MQCFTTITDTTGATTSHPQRALIVEGGVMRGAWAAGALSALREAGEDHFDLVVAASSGACTAAYFVAGMVEEGLQVWSKCACGQRLLRKSNWLRLKPLLDLAYLTDHCFRKFVRLPVESFDNLPTRFEIVLTDCATGRAVYYVPHSETILDALRATASLPVATRGYGLVEGIPYADGMLADPIPIRRVLQAGATDITVVLTRDPHTARRGMPGWLCRLAYPRFARVAAAWHRQHQIYQASLDILAHPPAGVRVRALYPRQPLPVERFTNECELVSAAVEQGRAEVLGQLTSDQGSAR